MERIKLIAYDLHYGSEDAYRRLIDAIERITDASIEIEKSVWVVASDYDCECLRDSLKDEIGSKDKLFVAPLPTGSYWYNIGGLKDFLNRHR